MAPPKGKAPTKGAKQILVENQATVSFYSNMAFASIAFHVIFQVLLYFDNVTALSIFMNCSLIFLYVVTYNLMKFASKPKYGENAQLIDPGLDLNMEGGMGEHVKDIVILSSITHVLATFSNYFWFLLLLLPIRVFWLVWVNFLGPWFFQEAPQDAEQDEKKRKKIERKMKRYQQ